MCIRDRSNWGVVRTKDVGVLLFRYLYLNRQFSTLFIVTFIFLRTINFYSWDPHSGVSVFLSSFTQPYHNFHLIFPFQILQTGPEQRVETLQTDRTIPPMCTLSFCLISKWTGRDLNPRPPELLAYFACKSGVHTKLNYRPNTGIKHLPPVAT